MKEAHRQSSKALKDIQNSRMQKCPCVVEKSQRGSEGLWWWWEFNVLSALSEKDSGLHAGGAVMVSRVRSATKIQTVNHVWTPYEWTKCSQCAVCCGRAALSQLLLFAVPWRSTGLDRRLECYSGVLAMELGAEFSTGFMGGMALWLKYSTTCLGTSARTHLASAAGEACKMYTFIDLHEGEKH